MFSVLQDCFISTVGIFSITPFTIASIFILLPLYILVLYLGLQQWQQQHSSRTISHSDLLTCHMVIIEVIGVFGATLACCGGYTDLPQMIMVALNLLIINFNGQMCFHILTCVERYLAVVHPITYLSLRKAKGIRIRNITIGCVWLLCFAMIGFMYMEDQVHVLVFILCCTAVFFCVVSFCSLSVLCVLIRPGPGEGGGGRQRVDQSKLRAFHTIMAILGVLLFRFVGGMFAYTLYQSPQLGEAEKCGVLFSTVWFSLPSSLVLPLLFLHRAGKLLCCKNNKESGRGSD